MIIFSEYALLFRPESSTSCGVPKRGLPCTKSGKLARINVTNEAESNGRILVRSLLMKALIYIKVVECLGT